MIPCHGTSAKPRGRHGLRKASHDSAARRPAPGAARPDRPAPGRVGGGRKTAFPGRNDLGMSGAVSAASAMASAGKSV